MQNSLVYKRTVGCDSGSSNQVLCDNLERCKGWEVEERFKREGIYVYLWLTHVDIWKKSTQYCKVAIPNLKKLNFKKKNSWVQTMLLMDSILPRWLKFLLTATQWTLVWANSKRLWRTGKPGMLQSLGSQRIWHNLANEQQRTTTTMPNCIGAWGKRENQYYWSFLL